MRQNLLEFLFGRATVQKSADLGEDVVRLFEQAEAAELEPVTTSEKKPLAAALKDIGISGKTKQGTNWVELSCDDERDYHEHCRLLSEPENISKLAEKGWVAVKLGDSAMSNEAAHYRIGFIEIKTAATSDADKPDEKIKTILDKGQEFATTPVAVDTEENPIDRETGKPSTKQGGKTKGVGKTKEGEDPEGKLKGAKKVKETSPRAKQIAGRLLDEMTGTGSMGTVEAGMAAGLASKPNQPKQKLRPNRHYWNRRKANLSKVTPQKTDSTDTVRRMRDE